MVGEVNYISKATTSVILTDVVCYSVCGGPVGGAEESDRVGARAGSRLVRHGVGGCGAGRRAQPASTAMRREDCERNCHG